MAVDSPFAVNGVFRESQLAHQLLDGLEGIEIGPAAHNPFGLKTRSVGLTSETDAADFSFYEKMQLENCGAVAAIDIGENRSLVVETQILAEDMVDHRAAAAGAEVAVPAPLSNAFAVT